MPTALSTINTAKDQAATYQPLLLARFTFADGAVLRLSTHPLNAAEGGTQYGGADWYGRISEQSIQQVQALAESGIDLIPSVSLAIADPDSYIYTNWELASGRGLKGAQLELILVFYNPIAGTFSSDYRIPFIGVCEHPASDATKLTVAAVAKTSLMRAMLPVTPIQQRCPWINPTTDAQRALADNEDSAFYECGETRDLTTAPPCEYTRATCTQANRFGGITYIAPAGMHVREYTSGNWLDVKGITNEARYGDYLPMLYGAAWVEPPVMSSIPDGNYLRGECIVCLGPADIMRVTVNGIELSPANQQDGTPYAYANNDFRYNWINAGDRDGSPNTDVPWSGDGDPYGSMTAIQWTLPRSSAGGDGIPRVRVLAKRKSLRRYRAISSVVVASDVATIYFSEVNNDCAWSGSATVTLSGTSSSALNVAWTSAMLNSAYGPPGMVQITVSGVADGTYTGGFIRYATGGENVAWVIADLLTWTNYAYDDLDIASFCEAAAALESRPCAIVLRQRRSAAEIIRSLRQAHSLLMVPEHSTGKLKLILKRTLADQQPAAVDGSNYNTAISSKTAAGTSTNGYAAYRFDAASILRVDQPISLKEISRASADSPNRISLAFQDRTRDYAISTLSVVDSDDTQRMDGQEIAGGLAVQPDGITSYDDAMRAARVAMAEIHRGNDDADTRGTRVFEWETSFRALHLRVGHLVLLNDTLKGLTNQLVRVTKIQPSQNFETVKLTAHWHEDDWYTDAYASTGALASRRDEQAARRAPYIWQPNSASGVTGDALYPSGRNAFSLYAWYDEQADGSQLAKLRIAGELPQNCITSALTPPIVPLQATTSDTGGSLAGERSYFLALCPVDSSGNRGPLSAIVRADITDSGSANTITLSGLEWDAATASYILYAGLSHLSLCAQTAASGKPSTITWPGDYQAASFGLPDLVFDRLRVTATRIRTAGVFTGAISARTSTSITFAGQEWTTDQWAGRIVSFVAAGAGGLVPLAHFAITANDADTLTLSGSPIDAGLVDGDYATIRLDMSESGAVLTDAALALTVDAEIGKMLRVIAGTGAGQERRIVDNDATSVTLEAALDVALGSDSVVVIEEPLPDVSLESAPQVATAPGLIDLDLSVGNYPLRHFTIRAETLSASGASAPLGLSATRDALVFGAPGGAPGGASLPDPLAEITAEIGEYTNGADGDNYAHVAGTFPVPADADVVGIWVVESATTPAAQSFGELVAVAAERGAYDFWYRRARAGGRLWVMGCAADAAGGRWRRPSASEPATYVDIPAWGVPAQPTACSVSQANFRNIDGADYCDLTVAFTPPASADYQWTVVERYWADASWNPAPGEGATQEEAFRKNGQIKERYSFTHRQVKLPNALTRLVYRFRSADWSGRTNDAGVVYVNFEQQPSGGLDLSKARASSMGKGIQLASDGRLSATARGALGNAAFEFGLADWSVFGGGWTADAAEAITPPYSAKGVPTGSNAFLYQDLPAMPGEIFTLEALARTTLNGSSTARMGVSWLDSAGAYLSEASIDLAGDVASKYSLTATMPAGAAWVRVFVLVGAAATLGRLLVDQVRLTKVEALAGGLERTSAGTRIADGGVTPSKLQAGTEPLSIVSGIPGSFTGQRLVYNSLDGRVYRWNGVAYVAIQTAAEIKTQLQASGLTAAEFASSVEPVSIVSTLPAVKSTSTVFLTTDGKLYRWNGVGYVRPMTGSDIKAELSIDKLTAGQISAGAISTEQLSATEILLGGGGGKCPRLRVNDGFGTMIGFLGDDQAGFIGAYFSRARIGGTFSAPVIDMSTSGASIAGADFALTTAYGSVQITKATASVHGRSTTVMQNVSGSDRVAIGQREIALEKDGYLGVGLRGGTPGNPFGAITLLNYGSQTIGLDGGLGKVAAVTADLSTSLRSPVINASQLSFPYNAGEFRSGGSVVIDANRNYRWPASYAETLVLGSLTSYRWLPAYDAGGNYLGKIPLL